MHGMYEKCIQNPKGGNQFGDLDVNGRINLKLILKK
jgi:hypothetical protein